MKIPSAFFLVNKVLRRRCLFVMKEKETSAECLTCICFHLTEKMTPQGECSVAETLTPEEEHQMKRMMAKREKIIKELIQTEKDYLNDLELCVREVVQPLRNKKVNAYLRFLFFSIFSLLHPK